ncbi:sensor histidine kinase [Clostridium botulinum]|uniref:sensor histidine kinase n=1 Tax=Clostridium botulinum TaxID=1491 RepID=UPI0004D3403C|nr:HAMP domain-containing sensor histidine kinase [Clostridium botulinum]KEI03648.1 histidine kinase [Clostridium botulinum D str. 16868]KLU77054.1 histidine kinase [Clostridium botulinum V891]KOA74171.1 histidine kinase [Clostridium botulinum]KOA92383.1 histidine kinase [Clostridium botulinum]KOC36673.1 histidine kinase [Clostridium botulinum]
MRISIKYKVVVGLLFIFCIGFNMISIVTSKIIMKNNKEIISKEFLNAQRDGTFYVNEYFKQNSVNKSLKGFENKVEEITFLLSAKLDDRVIVYSNKGKFLFDTIYFKGDIFGEDNNKLIDNKKDINLAINNKSGYTILKDNDKYIVNFSYPLFIDKDKVGIIRYTRDYSDIFLSGKNLLNLIKLSILMVFIVIFLFAVFLSKKITFPIIKLNNISKEISKGNYNISASIKSNDEIGELTESFDVMKECIRNQISTIKEERDNLKKSESHKKSFFDNVTHELKTPLTVISGYSQIMMNKGFDDKEFFNKAVSRIKNEADRMHNMVLKLLDISKSESKIKARYERVNISNLIYKLCEDMEVKSKKYGMSIDKNIENHVYISGNSEELVEMFINIIDNSIKYGDINTKIKLNLRISNGVCVVIIEDRGKGIPKEKLNKIFKPFYRVDKNYSRERGSSGLGLYIVKNIINAHKGEVQVQSTENVGTKVIVRIPSII